MGAGHLALASRLLLKTGVRSRAGPAGVADPAGVGDKMHVDTLGQVHTPVAGCAGNQNGTEQEKGEREGNGAWTGNTAAPATSGAPRLQKLESRKMRGSGQGSHFRNLPFDHCSTEHPQERRRTSRVPS